MWANIQFEVDKKKDSKRKKYLKAFGGFIATTFFNVLFAVFLVWMIEMIFGVRLNAVWTFVFWLVMYLLPGIEAWLNKKANEEVWIGGGE